MISKLIEDTTSGERSAAQQWRYLIGVGAVMVAYYVIFYLPPRLVGSNDPDRYYHLGLSRLIAEHGLLRTLPQAEDLGWGSYFPDKEFLFHALTGAADWLGGPEVVLLVTPLIGIAIIICLFTSLLKVLSPGSAAALVLVATFLSPIFIFRLTMLRPHLLAIFFFCLLVAAILRGRPLLSALASAGFVMSYHAFYIPLLVVFVAALFRWTDDSGGARRWQWAIPGVVVGIILNPYFPSNIVMSWIPLKIAIGAGLPLGLRSGDEVQPFSLAASVHYIGFLPIAIAGGAAVLYFKRLRPRPDTAALWFLFVLSATLTMLAFKSIRAAEYATPSVILLVGYSLARVSRQWAFPATCAALIASQGTASRIYYEDIWSESQGGDTPTFLAGIAQIPVEADGKKVFNCEWETGSHILFARPKVRFVDLLEPAFLWQASPAKYLIRQRLIQGLESDPYRVLREQFKADYVLCASAGLNKQMLSDPTHFKPMGSTEAMRTLRVYRLAQQREAN